MFQSHSPVIRLRTSLERALENANGKDLKNLFQDINFNRIFENASAMSGCDQGKYSHLEGDVAAHSVIAFHNFKKLAPQRLGREADLVELMAVVMHDLRKPQTREEKQPGHVSFPGHELLAAKEVPAVAQKIGLSAEESKKLHYLVAHHGDANNWLKLSIEQKAVLQSSPWIKSLALLQESDALACIHLDGGHSQVFWNEMMLPDPGSLVMECLWSSAARMV